jgi:hypothetical protein
MALEGRIHLPFIWFPALSTREVRFRSLFNGLATPIGGGYGLIKMRPANPPLNNLLVQENSRLTGCYY